MRALAIAMRKAGAKPQGAFAGRVVKLQSMTALNQSEKKGQLQTSIKRRQSVADAGRRRKHATGGNRRAGSSNTA